MKHRGFVESVARSVHSLSHFALAAASLAALSPPLIAEASPIELKVMSRNLYFGADLTPVFTSPVASIPVAVADLIANVAASKPEERMQRVAQEIFLEKPHIVGLQEASLWRSQTPSDFVPGPLAPPNASAPLFGGDFSQQIVNALAGLGMSYKIYAFKQNADNELPGFDPTAPGLLSDYRLTDHNVILVRDDLPASALKVLGEGASTFATNLTIPFAGSLLELTASYGYVDVDVGGKAVRVFNTHLEPLSGLVNELQAAELIAAANASPYPQVFLGDFNTVAQTGPTLADDLVLAAGFADAWHDKGSGSGFTWGFDDKLSDPLGTLTQRLDYVFHRGGFGTLDIDVIGDVPLDIGNDGPPLWASDHAGVVATLQFIPVPGTLALVVLPLVVLLLTAANIRSGCRSEFLLRA